jgi:hypothetical protein
MRTYYADKQQSSYKSCILFLVVLLGIIAVFVRGLFVPWPDRVVAIVMWFIFGSSLATMVYLVVQVSLVLRFISHTRYELRDDALYLVLGPWKSRILYGSIVSVVRKDMAFGVASSFRVPGIAVFDVKYSDEGIVHMYSTHALKDVTLIKTVDGKKYGISPADPDGFLQELRTRTGEISGGTDLKTTTSGPWRLGWAAWVSIALAAATLVISMVMFPRLPESLVIHWDLLGAPNGSLPRFWGVFLMPFISLVLALIPLAMPDGSGTARRPLYALTVSVLPVLFLCQLFLLLWNTGRGAALAKIFMPLLIILIVGSIIIQLIYVLRVERRGKHSLSR